MTGEEVSRLVLAEIGNVSDLRVRAFIEKYLVPPYRVPGVWDYGRRDDTYVCWVIWEHSASDSGIVYCEEGFGPSSPWGLMFIAGPNRYRMGMDSQWFTSLQGAFLDSWAADEVRRNDNE